MVTSDSSDLDAWRDAVASYPDQIRAVGGKDFAAIDAFVGEELPRAIEERQAGHSKGGHSEGDDLNGGYITKEELEKVVQWKLRRGKWRPGMPSMVGALLDDDVRDASTKAFAALPQLDGALKALVVLRGVGPATASAVLAAHSPNVAPFMSDEAMTAAVGGKLEYTAKKYLAFAAKMQKKAQELAELSSKTGGGGAQNEGRQLAVQDLEKALWSSARKATAKKDPQRPKATEKKTEVAREIDQAQAEQEKGDGEERGNGRKRGQKKVGEDEGKGEGGEVSARSRRRKT